MLSKSRCIESDLKAWRVYVSHFYGVFRQYNARGQTNRSTYGRMFKPAHKFQGAMPTELGICRKGASPVSGKMRILTPTATTERNIRAHIPLT